MEKAKKQVLFEIKEGIGFLSVNRPEALNALNRPIVDEMEAILDRVAEDSSVRVLIVGGTEHFAAGADIKQMAECDPEGARAFAFNSCYNKLENLNIPTIAAIDGYALGGGLELALCCDMRIAAASAKLGLPETGLGIMPGAGGTIRLPRLVGYSKACELILLAKRIGAEEAERIGLVNAVVPSEELMAAAEKWAKKLALGAPVALAAAKETMRKGLTFSTIGEGIDCEAEAWAGLFATTDQKEGMRAFMEKRKPSFEGK